MDWREIAPGRLDAGPSEALRQTRAFRRRVAGARRCRLSAAVAFTLGSAVPLAQAGHAAGPVTITDSWFRYILPQVPAGGYMTLRNASDRAVALTGSASPACGMLMAHKTEEKGGMASMVPVQSVTVPAHGSFTFAPGGYHLMCMQPRMKAGEAVSVTLTFADGQRVVVPFAVHGANYKPGAH